MKSPVKAGMQFHGPGKHEQESKLKFIPSIRDSQFPSAAKKENGNKKGRRKGKREGGRERLCCNHDRKEGSSLKSPRGINPGGTI